MLAKFFSMQSAFRKVRGIFLFVVLLLSTTFFTDPVLAKDPWIINTPVTVTKPMQVGDVIIVSGGDLLVQNVPEPGFQISGNFYVIQSGKAAFQNSVIQVMSTYNGQYILLAADQGEISISECDYRIPAGVQHALAVVGQGVLEISDSDFGFAQLAAFGQGQLTASRLNGSFECLMQDDGTMALTDIPRDQNMGSLWVWPTFMPGSTAVYSPPATGFTTSFQFPPPDATGISQSFSITRCQVALWPLLVKEGSDLTIKDVTFDNRVIVGLHLPTSLTISGLTNGQTYADTILGLPDRTLHLINASIEAWNLYPEQDAQITIEDSLVGEILASGTSSTFLRNSVVDGTGGFFGANEDATIEAVDTTFTCHIQATKNSVIHLQRCQALPYSVDPTGDFTVHGAFDSGCLHLDGTLVKTKRVVGGKGAVVVTWITDPPAFPPLKGTRNTIHGYAAIYSLDWSTRLSSWTLTATPAGGPTKRIGFGFFNTENKTLGTWRGPQPNQTFELTLTLKDRSKRTYASTLIIPPQ